jgi:hypothetical protein
MEEHEMGKKLNMEECVRCKKVGTMWAQKVVSWGRGLYGVYRPMLASYWEISWVSSRIQGVS